MPYKPHTKSLGPCTFVPAMATHCCHTILNKWEASVLSSVSSTTQRKILKHFLSYPNELQYLSASAIMFYITTNDERFGADGVTIH